ncbi:MAG TPA: GNAT family protein [Acidobacteriaceae bacterium]|jgi:RimJ/RimL family protein N-acetyltransferase|nr:GNAT family protein [Acidobacteriaceae bacterium]
MKNGLSHDPSHDLPQDVTRNPAIPSTPIFEDILTPRLDLIAVTPESLHIQQKDGCQISDQMRAELGASIGATVPSEWPHEHWEPHVFEYLLNLFAESPEAIGWCRYLALRDSSSGTRTLIGSFGSGLPKPETGEAEIGYGILPSWQRQGFAPEAVAAMLPWLQTRREIRAFVAQTFPDLRGSIRVLEKCGFEPAGPGFEEGTILFRRGRAGSTP